MSVSLSLSLSLSIYIYICILGVLWGRPNIKLEIGLILSTVQSFCVIVAAPWKSVVLHSCEESAQSIIVAAWGPGSPPSLRYSHV